MTDLLLVLLNLLLDLLGSDELDRVTDELRVLLDDVLDRLLGQVIELVLFHVEDHLSSSSERSVDGVGGDGEGSSGSGLPDVLLVVVVLGDDGDFVGNEVGRAEEKEGGRRLNNTLARAVQSERDGRHTRIQLRTT